MTGSDPAASVIVPVYNDPAGLDRTLSALVSQTYPDYEVLVVDNGSTDDTPAVAADYESAHPRVTLLVEDDIQGSYAARNRGIEHAHGDVLAFVDADMTVEDDWLSSALRAMDRREAAYMGCRVEIIADRETTVARYNQLSGFPVESYVREHHYAPTCCLLVRRAVIEDVGPFDQTLVSGGDAEFGQRVHAAGYGIEYAPEVAMYHPARESLRALTKKYVRVGRGIYQRRPDDRPPRERAERFARRCLPPNPITFRSRMRARRADVPRSDLFAFYALDVLRKYSKTTGYLLEMAETRRLT
ncbi:glycosyltransferase [Halalkalicoccus subterraneus]|uniref:glycosyltransferase n=1 Tax=Halalkalicoccus subterraneus TaxID=2675002 RepID=UPI000EFC2DBD|nr:glycosyltransferase [Halalkalicoccus subterraneus]